MAAAENDSIVPPEQAAAAQMAQQIRAFKNGANWFYWVAGLSVVNSLISVFQGNVGFVVGLGVTQVVDAIARGAAEETQAASLIQVIGLVISLFFAGICLLFGWLANRGQGWAFLVGMVLYALDGLLFLLVRDWWSLGFHGFALVCMFQGYAALRRLKAAVPPTAGEPMPYGANPQ